jgi:HSP90 family molecular chaperone
MQIEIEDATIQRLAEKFAAVGLSRQEVISRTLLALAAAETDVTMAELMNAITDSADRSSLFLLKAMSRTQMTNRISSDTDKEEFKKWFHGFSGSRGPTGVPIDDSRESI